MVDKKMPKIRQFVNHNIAVVNKLTWYLFIALRNRNIAVFC